MKIKQFIQYMKDQRAVREAAMQPGKPAGIADDQARSVSFAKDEPRLNDTRKVSAKKATTPEMGGRKVTKPTAVVGKPSLNRDYMGARHVPVQSISEGNAEDGLPPQGGKSGELQRLGGAQIPGTGEVGQLDEFSFGDLGTSFMNGFNSVYKKPQVKAHQNVQATAAQNPEVQAKASLPPMPAGAKYVQFRTGMNFKPIIDILRLQDAGNEGAYRVFAGTPSNRFGVIGGEKIKLYIPDPKQQPMKANDPRLLFSTLVLESQHMPLVQRLIETNENIRRFTVVQETASYGKKAPGEMDKPAVARMTSTKPAGEIGIKSIGSQTPTAKVGKPELNLAYLNRRDVKVKEIHENLEDLITQAEQHLGTMAPAEAADLVVNNREDPNWKRVYDALEMNDAQVVDSMAQNIGYPALESIDPNLPNQGDPGAVSGVNREFLDLLDIDVNRIEEESALDMRDELKSFAERFNADISEVYAPGVRYVGTPGKKKVKPAFTGNGVRHIAKQRRRWVS